MNKYLTSLHYSRYVLKLANRYLLEPLETWISPDPAQPLLHPPIFFLGAPRSGSTLAIQVITDVLDVGYMSNKHSQWYGAPAIAERIFNPTVNRPSSDYASQHGDTKGNYAPAECGEWWYRFFRRNPAYVTLDDVDPLRMRQFRRSVAALTNAIDRPIVFKNLYASFRIRAIAHYFPECLFVVMHRNELDNGHSLLETRKKVLGDYDRWWSMEPPSIGQLISLPAHQQVIEQIRHIHFVIDRDLHNAEVASVRRFDLHYEQFCATPSSVIEDFQHFLSENNCEVQRRGVSPEGFPVRTKIKIDSDLYEAMAHYAQGT